jgi:hypothetical protein
LSPTGEILSEPKGRVEGPPPLALFLYSGLVFLEIWAGVISPKSLSLFLYSGLVFLEIWAGVILPLPLQRQNKKPENVLSGLYSLNGIKRS